MRQSIGTSFMLNFIILFIFLVFAFLAGTLSYYKSYRVNNCIVNAIERYEGYNDLAIEEINNNLKNLAYETQMNIDCPEEWKAADDSFYEGEFNRHGRLISKDNGYCIYLYDQDNNFESHSGGLETTDNYYTYGVLTYIQFQMPGLQYLLKIPVFSRTNRMYHYGG